MQIVFNKLIEATKMHSHVLSFTIQQTINNMLNIITKLQMLHITSSSNNYNNQIQNTQSNLSLSYKSKIIGSRSITQVNRKTTLMCIHIIIGMIFYCIIFYKIIYHFILYSFFLSFRYFFFVILYIYIFLTIFLWEKGEDGRMGDIGDWD